MRSTLILATAATFVTMVGSSAAQETTIDRAVYGRVTYELTCAVCHGLDATGEVSALSPTAVPAPDLTGLTRQNGGTFPAEQIARIIDGREVAPAHGGQMPAWGLLFLRDAQLRSPGPDFERLAQQRISDLVAYIGSLQR